jgi:2-isopropylmalate synthase
MADDRVIIFDTTLRDGEQSPGASMNIPEKLEIARALAELGVDVIEAGFPIASPGDFEAVQLIAREITGGPVICGLARCSELDINRAGAALEDAVRRRIHVFLATSAIHREFKLKMAKEEIIRRAVEGVRLARQFTDDVEFSPEDAGRTELDFLSQVVEAVIDAGATTVNIPDTVGYCTPDEFGRVIAHLRAQVPNINRAVISVHCHNDLGLAVANSLAAVQNGARQVECTINGIGERAGNCSLEEIVMALSVRQDRYGPTTGINTRRLLPTSRLVSNTTGLQVQRNKAIVGQNAFAHEAGIHQDGMLKERRTYEIMRPEDVGLTRSELVLGKHSGRHALRQRIVDMGYNLSDEQLDRVFAEFKALCDKKKEVFDADIEALVAKDLHATNATWSLRNLVTVAGASTIPTANVTLTRYDGVEVKDAAFGGGPVDAVIRAMAKITGVEATLTDFRVRSISRGQDSLAETYMELKSRGKLYRDRAISTDTIEAAAEACLNILNRIIQAELRNAVEMDTRVLDLAAANTPAAATMS